MFPNSLLCLGCDMVYIAVLPPLVVYTKLYTGLNNLAILTSNFFIFIYLLYWVFVVVIVEFARLIGSLTAVRNNISSEVRMVVVVVFFEVNLPLLGIFVVVWQVHWLTNAERFYVIVHDYNNRLLGCWCQECFEFFYEMYNGKSFFSTYLTLTPHLSSFII